MPKFLIIELKHDTSSREEKRLLIHLLGDDRCVEVIEQAWVRHHHQLAMADSELVPELDERVYKDYEDVQD